MEMPRRFNVEPPRRVLVIGSPGSGAGALAARLATQFGLSVFHPSLARPAIPAARRDAIAARVADHDWVMAASDAETVDAASRRAEWLVWIDLPASSCFVAVVREALMGKLSGQSAKPGDGLSLWAQIKRVANYPAEMSPTIMATIERERRNRTIYILRTKRDLKEFLANLPGISGFDDNVNGRRKPAG